MRESTGRAGPDLYHLTLLACNQTGLNNLYKLSSLAYIEGFYYKPRVDWALLEDCSEGLVCLSGCLASRLNHYLLTGQADEARKWLGDMRELFGPEHFYVELQNPGLPEQNQVFGPALAAARELDIPPALTNDCHYMEAEDSKWHEVLLCISTRKTLADPARLREVLAGKDIPARDVVLANAAAAIPIAGEAEGFAEGLEKAAEAVELNPAYVQAIIKLGITQQELGLTDEAIETFTRALELRPEYVDLHYRLGILHTDRRQFAEAVEHMEAAADGAPDNTEIRAGLALSLQNMGLMDRAAATWRSLCQATRAVC